MTVYFVLSKKKKTFVNIKVPFSVIKFSYLLVILYSMPPFKSDVFLTLVGRFVQFYLSFILWKVSR